MKRGLFIGVAYQNTAYTLPGCINDILRINRFALSNGFSTTRLMHDELSLNHTDYPNRNNVILAIFDSVRKTGPSDSLWIHFSGHGFYVESGNVMAVSSGGSISATATECILLRNADSNHLKDISETNTLCDEQMTRIFDHLPSNANVMVTIDACHSGRMFDLRYNMKVKGSGFSVAQYEMHERKSPLSAGGGHYLQSPKNVAIFTAVQDEKFAWDVEGDDGHSYGIFTTFMMDILEQMKREQRSMSYMDLLYLLNKKLQSRENKQDPQLSVPYREMAEAVLWV